MHVFPMKIRFDLGMFKWSENELNEQLRVEWRLPEQENIVQSCYFESKKLFLGPE